MLSYDDAERHFHRLKAASKFGAAAEFVDARTTTLLDRMQAEGPVAILGSKAYSRTEAEVQSERRFYLQRGHPEVIGIDIAEGLNVDVVADLCDDRLFDQHPGLQHHFGWIGCGALMEHVKDPQAAARNITQLLAPGGVLHFHGPWVWGYHPYPDDYQRLSRSGVAALFPELVWEDFFYTGTRGKWWIRLSEPGAERTFFQIMLPPPETPQHMWQLLSDRAMAYLNVHGLGRRPQAS